MLTLILQQEIDYQYDWERALIGWLAHLEQERLLEVNALVHQNIINEII